MNNQTKTVRNTIYLFITAIIWGVAFVAQAAGNVMGPFTFNALRNLLAFLALLPIVHFFYGNLRVDQETLKGGIFCGIFLFLAGNVQQVGLLYTSPGKAGFITSCYMIVVPIVGVFLGRKPEKRVLFAVGLGLLGLYFLCIPRGEGMEHINLGDLLSLICAFLYTAHILCIDYFTSRAEGIKMSCIQFLVSAVLTAFLMFGFEKPDLHSIKTGLVPLLYAGILSSGVGYSLQIVGQKGVNPTIAALILSLESCFSVLAGWMILGSSLNFRELFGCFVMFGAIILTQLPGKAEKKTEAGEAAA